MGHEREHYIWLRFICHANLKNKEPKSKFFCHTLTKTKKVFSFVFSVICGDFSSILHHPVHFPSDFEEIELKTRTPMKSQLEREISQSKVKSPSKTLLQLDPDSILAISTPSS
jgi:hypothetical protein